MPVALRVQKEDILKQDENENDHPENVKITNVSRTEQKMLWEDICIVITCSVTRFLCLDFQQCQQFSDAEVCRFILQIWLSLTLPVVFPFLCIERAVLQFLQCLFQPSYVMIHKMVNNPEIYQRQ